MSQVFNIVWERFLLGINDTEHRVTTRKEQDQQLLLVGDMPVSDQKGIKHAASVVTSRAAKRGGGVQTKRVPDLDLSFLFVFFCYFWDFPDFSGIFPICPGTLRGFSRFVPFLFLGLLTAPIRNSSERVHDTIRTFPEKSGNPLVWNPPGLASLNYCSVSPSPPFSWRGMSPFPVPEAALSPWEVLLLLQNLQHEAAVLPTRKSGGATWNSSPQIGTCLILSEASAPKSCDFCDCNYELPPQLGNCFDFGHTLKQRSIAI